MEIIQLRQDTAIALPPTAATIGFFDGVHLGHRFLLDRLCTEARNHSLRSLAVTFERHPRQVLQKGWTPVLLTPLEEKLRQLETTGTDTCCVLPFTRELAQLSAYDFMRQVLRERLNVRLLCIGYDHRFGHHREEGFSDYVEYGNELGISVVKAEPLQTEGMKVSSSAIRQLLSEGRVDEAARCLGRPYRLSGDVVDGFHEGRRLGFPTANIRPLCTEQMVPCQGVYAVRAHIEGESKTRPAMMNIGTRPTYGQHQLDFEGEPPKPPRGMSLSKEVHLLDFEGEPPKPPRGMSLSMEVHLLDFQGDLYGQRLDVDFVHRLRDERRFDTTAELRQQLRQDALNTVRILNYKL